jgi:pimeloyl-ACP methyl ester carboxylesterase
MWRRRAEGVTIAQRSAMLRVRGGCVIFRRLAAFHFAKWSGAARIAMMPALSFAPALSLLAAFQRVSPVRPLRTLVRATEDRFRPRQLAAFTPATSPAQVAMLGGAGAGLHQLATIFRERGRGRVPTIVLGGFVPDSTEQVFLLRRFFLRSGDLYYVNYARAGFSVDLQCAQLSDLVADLARRGEAPVVFGVSFGGGLALEWLRRARLAGTAPALGGVVLISPVACVDDLLAPGSAKPATLLGRAVKPYLGADPADEKGIEKSRAIFARMFEAGAQNKMALRLLMTQPELTRLREAVMATIRQITADGARERVGALRAMPAPPDYFSPTLLPLTDAPTLVLFAECEEAVIDGGSPTRFALERAHRAYFPQSRVERVAAPPGAAPVQHASLIFHVFEFLQHLGGFYAKLRNTKLGTAA